MEEIKAHTFKWYEFGCKDASYLQTKSLYSSLSSSEKILFKFHLLTCKYCRRFVGQVNKIDALIRQNEINSTLQMSPKRKIAINQLITDNLTKN